MKKLFPFLLLIAACHQKPTLNSTEEYLEVVQKFYSTGYSVGVQEKCTNHIGITECDIVPEVWLRDLGLVRPASPMHLEGMLSARRE